MTGIEELQRITYTGQGFKAGSLRLSSEGELVRYGDAKVLVDNHQNRILWLEDRVKVLEGKINVR